MTRSATQHTQKHPQKRIPATETSMTSAVPGGRPNAPRTAPSMSQHERKGAGRRPGKSRVEWGGSGEGPCPWILDGRMKPGAGRSLVRGLISAADCACTARREYLSNLSVPYYTPLGSRHTRVTTVDTHIHTERSESHTYDTTHTRIVFSSVPHGMSMV